MTDARTALGRFPAGVSGNLSGRPRIDPVLRAACREVTLEVVDAWKDEVRTRGPDWIVASKLLMAYGHGTPAMTLAVAAADPIEPPRRGMTIDPKSLTTEELEFLIRIQRRFEGVVDAPPALPR